MSAKLKTRLTPLLSSNKQDWETPPELFEKVDKVFGFELDVCASEHAEKCDTWIQPDGVYFTDGKGQVFQRSKEDGLSYSWGSAICWMNPPYGRELPKWMAKAVEESEKGATVVALVPARTDTKWWNEYVVKAAACVVLLKGRLKFVGAKDTAPFPSAIIVYSPRGWDLKGVKQHYYWDWKNKEWGDFE